MELTPEILKEIKYVVVTVKLKDSANLNTKGYFVGIRSIVDRDLEIAKAKDMYVWVYRKGSVHMFHLDYYYVEELSFGFGDSGASSSTKGYSDAEEDQKVVIEKLQALALALRENGAGKVNGLIDYEKYTSVSASLKTEIESAKTEHTRSGAVNYSTRGKWPSTGYGNSYGGIKTDPASPYTEYTGHTWQRKEVSTISFHRTTRYDVSEALTEMEAKIAEIRAGTYEAPKLHKIPADSIKEGEETGVANTSVADDDDYMYNYGLMCG